MPDVIVRWRVQGRVQGVGFRWFVREAARALELRGWVRNEENGDVVLEAAGAPDALERLGAAVRQGPPSSQVTALTAETPTTLEGGELPTPFAVHR